MKDFADKEWLSKPAVSFPDENWVLSRRFSPKPDPDVDRLYELRAQKAWQKARSIGSFQRKAP